VGDEDRRRDEKEPEELPHGFNLTIRGRYGSFPRIGGRRNRPPGASQPYETHHSVKNPEGSARLSDSDEHLQDAIVPG
jgi:hypothetical protein